MSDVHLVGKVEPAIFSVFFPTAYPDRGTAALFKLYIEHAPDAKLNIIGMADPRGPNKANQMLSARRAMIVKDFLIAQGIPADRITLQIKGASAPLDLETVKQLEAANSQAPNLNWLEKPRPTKLAYDRRVDVAILPAAVDSARFFPHAANDATLLIDPHWLGESTIHKASE